MTMFHDVRFPSEISRRAQALLERRTEVVVLASGHERRNARWAAARRRWQVGYGCHSLDDLQRVIAFFEARSGRLHAFRFRDWTDWKSCLPQADPAPGDQPIGTGDGAQRTFSLVKRYASGPAAFVRPITRPVAASVRIAVDGAEMNGGWSLDAATGRITFDEAPPPGAAITAGYEFDVPARFGSDELRIDMAAFGAGAAPDIEIVEVRE